jgi:4-alpha-glucanotransferase
MPVGVHPDGYDTWRYRTQFALGCSTGAPPDSFFSLGQDWGFPPLHPEAIRCDGYEYVARCFRHQMRYASVLRIDHVMWMHRLYFVPIGADARSGVYVRYRPDELYAVTCLEAQRAGCTVVGEDLGTVPPNVRSAMTEHGLHRMHVLQFEAPAKGRLRSLSRVSVASLNTHDMPPFAGFCRGLDIDERVRSNLLDEASASRERAHRLCVCNNLARVLCPGRPRFDTLEEVDIAELVAACSEFLASSEAALLLVNLEDLWLETQPQNRPGTGAEQPNWRRKFRLTLEQICDDPTLHDRLNRISRLRRPDGHEND